MKPRLLSLLLATALLAQGAPSESAPPSSTAPAAQDNSRAIADGMKALHAATKGILYSLEPWGYSDPQDLPADKTLHNTIILGQMDLNPKQLKTVVDEFQSAMDKWDAKMSDMPPGSGIGFGCFNPRHNLRITMDGHTYDFLICYECGNYVLYQDGRQIKNWGLVGSPKALNDLLAAAKVRLSQSVVEAAAMEKNAAEDRARWFAATPNSIKSIWSDESWADPPKAEAMRPLLAAEYPDVTPRIRALLSWYGSDTEGIGGRHGYEVACEALLFPYTPAEIVAAIHSAPLTDTQLDGAFKFLSGEEMEAKALPADIKAALLEHAMKSNIPLYIALAKHMFSPSVVPAQTPPASAK